VSGQAGTHSVVEPLESRRPRQSGCRGLEETLSGEEVFLPVLFDLRTGHSQVLNTMR
jgi:hypothetical protein